MQWRGAAEDWPLAEHSRFILHKPHHWHCQIVGKGPQILLLHGAGGATQSWRHLTPLLAERFEVIQVDLPGQGFTRLGAQQRCGLDPMAEDLLGLCSDQGWEPSALIGHSAGAAIALRMAEQLTPAPPVIGINAALDTFKGIAGLLFPAMAKTLAAMPLVADLFTASATRPSSVRRLIEGTGSSLPDTDLGHYRRLVGSRSHVDATLSMMAQWTLDPLRSRLPRHPSRTLLITGSADKAVPPQTSDQVAALMPDCTVQRLEGLGHLAHEEDASRIAPLITSFLDGLPAA